MAIVCGSGHGVVSWRRCGRHPSWAIAHAGPQAINLDPDTPPAALDYTAEMNSHYLLSNLREGAQLRNGEEDRAPDARYRSHDHKLHLDSHHSLPNFKSLK